MKKKKPIDPALKQVLIELEEVVMRTGYKIRYEKGNFEGGYCVLRDSSLIVVNNRGEMEKRISIVCRCLKEIGIDDIFVKPGLREIIENESSKPKEKDSDEIPDEEIPAAEISGEDITKEQEVK